MASFDGHTLNLPAEVDVFPVASLNRDLLVWLTAAAAHAVVPALLPVDPLQRDIVRLRAALRTVRSTLAACPGLATVYCRLAEATRGERKAAALPPVEQRLEQAIVSLLAASSELASIEGDGYVRLLLETDASLSGVEAPVDYQTFVPVPIWLALDPSRPSMARGQERDHEEGGGAAEGEKRLNAERRQADQTERPDSLILHRFEHILTWGQFLNVNRHVDDDEEDSARKVADDADRISVVKHRKKAATRLKFDLDLAPEDVDTERLSGTSLFPEWDFRRGAYLSDHCRVLESVADAAPEGLKLEGDSRRRVAAVRRRFEALRPRRTIQARQIDGDELDLDAAIRSAVEFQACGEASDRIWRQRRNDDRDLAVSLLMDTSRSTEAACGARTVIEIAREALVALTEGIAACGDKVAVHGFSSLRRDRVFLRRVKAFDEPITDAVRARVASLRPGFYTRIGPAIRYAARGLAAIPSRKRLLLVLTDGKPNDLDYYEGRYGIEDTRRAVIEARRQGLAVFGVTIDAKARAYFPYLFGANGYAIVSRPEKLADALPIVWQHLVE